MSNQATHGLNLYWATATPMSWQILQSEYRDLADALEMPGEDDPEYNAYNLMSNYLDEVLQRQAKSLSITLTIEEQEMFRMESTIDEMSLGIHIIFTARYE